MSKTYDELKGQFSALKETAVYIRNRINVLNRFLEEKPYQTVAFLGCGSSFRFQIAGSDLPQPVREIFPEPCSRRFDAAYRKL